MCFVCGVAIAVVDYVAAVDAIIDAVVEVVGVVVVVVALGCGGVCCCWLPLLLRLLRLFSCCWWLVGVGCCWVALVVVGRCWMSLFYCVGWLAGRFVGWFGWFGWLGWLG